MGALNVYFYLSVSVLHELHKCVRVYVRVYMRSVFESMVHGMILLYVLKV